MDATVSRESIWQLISSMSRDNQEWLAEKLHNEMELKKEETLKPYTMEELNARIDEFEANLEAEEWLTEEEANREVREALPWLK